MEKIIDEVTVSIKSGAGGKGCESHLRLSFRKMMPTGGEGGRGGSILMRADANLSSLQYFLYKRHFAAQPGGPGGNNHKRGKQGEDLVIRVPCGTSIIAKEKNFLIRDLVHDGEEVVLLEGGRGGGGNEGKKEAQPGEPAKSLDIVLSWKIPADVFLLGLPSSGKSKLLNRLTHAKAKVGDYPFTTKQPELGIYETGDYRQLRLCELPGVYRESFEGRGAGINFLKHLSRAKLNLLILDPLNHFAGSLKESLELLKEILERYDPGFLKLPRAVVVNKMDVPEAREKMTRRPFQPEEPLFLVSAETGEGLQPLMRYVEQITRTSVEQRS